MSGALPRISGNLLKVSKNNMIINKHFTNDTEGEEGERQNCVLLLLGRIWGAHCSLEIGCTLNNRVSGVYLSWLVLTLLALDAEEKIVS